MRAKWDGECEKIAFGEGWGIFDVDCSGRLEIQRLDEMDTFECDEDARKWVKLMALRGSRLHQLAVNKVEGKEV